jgi:hypothetical protein
MMAWEEEEKEQEKEEDGREDRALESYQALQQLQRAIANEEKCTRFPNDGKNKLSCL